MHKLILSFIILSLLTGTVRGEAGAEEASGLPAQLRAVESTLVRVGVPETDAAKIVGSMIDAGFSPEQMALITQQVQAAAGERSTQEAVVGKIREGLAKRVGPEGIVKATDRVRERYGFAMDTARTLAPGQYADLGGILADGLASGLTREDSERIVAALQARAPQADKEQHGLAVESLVTSRDMVRLGVSSKLSASVLGGALEKGYDGASMQLLRQAFSEQRMLGNMDQVAQKFMAAIQRGVRAKDLGSRVGARNGKGSGGSGSGGGSGGAGAGSGSGGGAGSSSGGHGGGSGAGGGKSGRGGGR
jgi:hypothetical protein